MRKKIDIACIVDDDPIYVFATKKVMRMAGFCESFLVFKNGKEALESLSAIVLEGSKMPEVILLDLNMPVMDGWQFLDEFTQIQPPQKITIYIVTSSINPEDVERAKAYEDVANYIVKPVSEKSLYDILEDFKPEE